VPLAETARREDVKHEGGIHQAVDETMQAWGDRIICGDARQMAEVPDAAVHLIVTSPPYNVAKGYADHNDDLTFEQYVQR
jgi:hypothetical protein